MDARLLNDVLECSVCLEQLDDTSRVLPCQHTFCLRCLQDIVQSHKELRCPECRALVTVALENLPSNILLMRILEGLRNTNRCSLGSPGAVVSNTPPRPSLQACLIPTVGPRIDGPPLTQAPPLPPVVTGSSQTAASSAFDSGFGLERSMEVSSSINRDISSSSSNPFVNIVGSLFMGGGSGSSILSSLTGDTTPELSGQQSFGNGSNSLLGDLSVGITRPISSSPSTTLNTLGSSHGVSSISSNNHLSISATTGHRQHSSSGQQPCAKALYNYDRKEPRDLSFKKGDSIILRKKIDSNWYQGELNGYTGCFPASYVQIIVPLASQNIPQCKALYDFKMTNDEERDCLTFNKGEVITVLRRVDENWAEGKLGIRRIGIFPLSFVDLNSPAKALMKLSLNASAGPSRIAPPTPTTLEDPPSLYILADIGPPTVQAPPPPHTDINSSSSSSSSVVTSPDPSITPPPTSSPPHILTTTTTPLLRPGPNSRQHREKRHSFTAVRSYNPSSPSRSPTASPHRHSLEIVSCGDDKSGLIGPLGLGAGGLGTSLANKQNVSANYQPEHGQPSGQPAACVESSKLHLKPDSGGSAKASLLSPEPISSSATQVNVTTFFVALYTYRGRKTDELDLRKSYLYTVNEKCHDGWYKGRCITTDKIGVFPGNYVAVAKPQMIAAYLAKRNSRHSSHHNRSNNRSSISISNSSSQPSSSSSSVVSYTRPRQNTSKSADGKIIHDAIRSSSSSSSPPSSLPPELPPRSVSAVATVDITSSSGLVVHSSTESPLAPLWPNYSQGYSSINRSVRGHCSAVSAPPNVALAEGSPTPVAVTTTTTVPGSGTKADLRRCSKERGSCNGGSGGMSLMRKLTSSSKKKSKSPPPNTYSMDNPVFEDSTISPTPGNLHTTHTRSGSCPGTLLGGVATGLGFGPSSRQRSGGGSCRVRSRDRPNLFLTNLMPRGRSGSNPDNSGVGTGTSTSTSSDQADVDFMNSIDTSRRSKQPAPLIRERFRCIVPYPPNSGYELELQQGDIIYVHKKRDDGWYKGTLQRTGKTGLFPSSFVESY